MVERLEFEITAKDRTSGQFRSTEKEVQRLNATVKAGGKDAKAAAQSLKQLRQATASLGTTLKGDTNPALKRTADELRRVEQASKSANRELANTGRAMGKGTARANAYTRAATRGVAALGFISPTAATASAQIVDLTASTGAATVVIASLAVAGIALGGALIYSSKQAIAFETSFRGIRKTVSATEEEYAKLESANRSLAKSLGENVNTINEIGQAAGQLGIAIGDLAQFEQIVIELASASDISARAASFSFGGLIKVLGLTIDELDNLTDQVVGLGNTFAATESEIVGLMNRIAGAGAVLKIPAQDLISISTAFAAVRVEQEAAGTAIQKVMLSIQRAAVVGGKELRTFAKMLGITEQEFRNLVRSDPTKVFVDFVNALGKSGEQAQLWLKELGLTDQRLTRTFLKLSSAGDLLNESMREGSAAYEEGTARTEEFEKALATTGGSLRKAGASLVDLGITLGNVVTPAIREAAQGVAVFADAINDSIIGLGNWIDALGKGAIALGDFLEKTPLVGERLFSDDFFQTDEVLRFTQASEDLAAAIAALPEEKRIDVEMRIKSLDFLGTFEKAKMQATLLQTLESAGTDAALSFLVPGLDPGADRVMGFSDALANALGLASDLSSSLASGLGPELDSITDRANTARDALFAMFKEPTLEEKQATLRVQTLQLELRELNALQRAHTPAEADRVERLAKVEIPFAQNLRDVERSRRDIAKTTAEIKHGELQTTADLTAQINTQVADMQDLGKEVETFAATSYEFSLDIDLDDAAFALAVFEREQLGPLTREQHELVLALTRDEQVREDLERIIRLAKVLDGETFTFAVTISGVDAVIAELNRIIDTTNDYARAVGAANQINLLERGQDPTTIAGFENLLATTTDYATAVRAAEEINRLQREAAAQAERDRLANIPRRIDAQDRSQGAGKAAAAAKKEIDPLKDGIITLAEALEFGFTAATAATAELRKSMSDLAARFFRVNVESRKLASAESKRREGMEALLELAELEVERSTYLRDERIELEKLRVVLSETGLLGAFDTFAFAIMGLGGAVREASESTVQSLHRLATATKDAVQERFDGLFDRPSREQAELEFRLAGLRAQRQRLLIGGRTEQELESLTKPLDDEIAAIEAVIALRQAEYNVLRAEGLVADQTLMTDREIVAQAQQLIGTIAVQSAITDTLNTAILSEAVLRGRAIDSLERFSRALGGATGALGGRGPLVQVNVTTSVDELLEEVERASREALRDAGYGGVMRSSGAFSV